MIEGTRPVFFRFDSIVLLVSHPGQATFDSDQRKILSNWVRDLAPKILPDALSRLEIKDFGSSFSFSAEKNDRVQKSPTLQVDSIRPRSAKSETTNLAGHALAPNALQAVSHFSEQSQTDQAADSAPPSFTMVIQPICGILPAEILLLTKRLSGEQDSFNSMPNGNAKFTLKQVALNWYQTGGAHDGAGSGGPGGRPTPPGTKVTDHSFTLPLGVTNLLKEKTGASIVQVAILDTAPAVAAIETAIGGFQQNPLLQSLPGHLTVYTDSANQFPAIPVVGHDYNMSDHGLFVAGIIHSIAREAHLHLFQVLSDNGVGDTETIARGLLNVSDLIEQDSGTSKWVVNASLMMSAPANEFQLDSMRASLRDAPPDLSKDQEQEQNGLLAQLETLLKDPNEAMLDWLLKQQSLPVEYMCRFLHFHRNTYVIAAAGNDGIDGQPQPGARYPAKAHGVLGVGALCADGTDASYSNVDDDPLLEGMVTLGGEVPSNGVVGLYIGTFPTPPPGVATPQTTASPNGWAQWAGTSFATPVITGIIAKLLRSGNFAHAEDAITRLRQLFPPAAGVIPKRIMVPVTQA